MWRLKLVSVNMFIYTAIINPCDLTKLKNYSLVSSLKILIPCNPGTLTVKIQSIVIEKINIFSF